MNQAELRAGAAVGRAVGSLGAAGGDTRGERGRAVSGGYATAALQPHIHCRMLQCREIRTN